MATTPNGPLLGAWLILSGCGGGASTATTASEPAPHPPPGVLPVGATSAQSPQGPGGQPKAPGATEGVDAGAGDGGTAGDPTQTPTTARIKFLVHFAGKVGDAPLAVAAFTENPPKSRPPVSFDTSKGPAFPYSGELSDLDPGRYWVVALLERPPYRLASVKPGPQDLEAISDAIDVKAGDVRQIEINLPLTPAGADAGAGAVPTPAPTPGAGARDADGGALTPPNPSNNGGGQ